jgi:hypothetical protein
MPRNFEMPASNMKHEGPEQECPKCGAPCDHSDNEKHGYALDALREASAWYDDIQHTNKFIQYLPPIVDGDPLHKAFTTQEQLLGLGVVHRWSVRTGFVRFVILKIHAHVTQHKFEYALAAEMPEREKGGKLRPWLIGFLKNIDGLNIDIVPRWQEKYDNF